MTYKIIYQPATVFFDVAGPDILQVIKSGRVGIGDQLDLVRHFFGDVVLEFNQILDLSEGGNPSFFKQLA